MGRKHRRRRNTFLLHPRTGDHIVSEKSILLVEDNPDDAALTVHALETNNIGNRLVLARDGVEALDYLFCSGPYAGRDPDDRPSVVLLDLKLPKIDGLEVLRRVRASESTRLQPVV